MPPAYAARHPIGVPPPAPGRRPNPGGGRHLPPAAPPPMIQPGPAPAGNPLHPTAYGAPPFAPYPPDPSMYGYAQLGAVGPGATAFDVWQALFDAYLQTRNVGTTEASEAYPETTAGDVRRAALVLSRELCQARYDLADLVATRAAWRDALTRTQALCAPLAWDDPYPENERFWLSDALALAQRLEAIDVRRNGITADATGLLQVTGDHSDTLLLWMDLRRFYLSRRVGRRGGDGRRFPMTTVHDVSQVAQLIDGAVAEAHLQTLASPELAAFLHPELKKWRAASQEVQRLASQAAPGAPYPHNERFWLHDARRIAIRLSVLRDALSVGGAAS